MSGYGGQPPSGWQDPYDPYGGQQPQQAPGGWRDPNGYGYGYGPPGVPPGGTSNGSAIGALVVSIVEVVLCGGIFAVPGIVLAAMAMGRFKTDPESARKLTVWAWICAGIAPLIGIALLIVYFVYLANTSSTSTY
ncbi:MAG: hypothetical protein JWN52_2034 [Actinomycetia bacterium]|nr:hypothetical protein [Actinomycetes bacterium]